MAAAAEDRASIGAVLRAGAARLAATSDSPRLDAELLLEAACGIGRVAGLAHPERILGADQRARFDAAIARRAAGEPLAYITGWREFYSLPLAVSPAVLVPRPETELVVETALSLLGAGVARVLDLGTGSGAIALAIKQSRPDVDVTAADVDTDALAVAAANAARLGLDVRWVQSDWLAAFAGETFDLIVSNPPYVPSDDCHFDGPLAQEPRRALDGGADGLDAYRSILRSAREHLREGGALVLEHGFDQRDALTELAVGAGYRVIRGYDDLAGRPRVLALGVSV